MIIKYKHFNNLWERIGDIYEDSPFLQAFIWANIVFVPIISLLIFMRSLEEEYIDNAKKTDKTNVFTYTIVVERYNGLSDTIIYHDYEPNPNIEYNKYTKKDPVVITTHGKNWLGAEIDNEIRIDECKGFKIIK